MFLFNAARASSWPRHRATLARAFAARLAERLAKCLFVVFICGIEQAEDVAASLQTHMLKLKQTKRKDGNKNHAPNVTSEQQHQQRPPRSNTRATNNAAALVTTKTTAALKQPT